MKNFDAEEKDLLQSYENDEWVSVEEVEAEKEKYRQYAQATFKKDKRVSVRLTRKNLETLQKKALEEGIPYQTYIESILHKYASGKLVEKT
jgi:predicted DNA binding CopG/RHH family protein